MNSDTSDKIKSIDEKIMQLEIQKQELEDERYMLQKDNYGYFIKISSSGDPGYWDEYYEVPVVKELEANMEKPLDHKDWDPALQFYGHDRPYFQVSDDEYLNWRILAELLRLKRYLTSGVVQSIEIKKAIFDGRLSELIERVEHFIDEYYEKVGLEHRSFQHVCFKDLAHQ